LAEDDDWQGSSARPVFRVSALLSAEPEVRSHEKQIDRASTGEVEGILKRMGNPRDLDHRICGNPTCNAKAGFVLIRNDQDANHVADLVTVRRRGHG
jgi:hypothetical protein